MSHQWSTANHWLSEGLRMNHLILNDRYQAICDVHSCLAQTLNWPSFVYNVSKRYLPTSSSSDYKTITTRTLTQQSTSFLPVPVQVRSTKQILRGRGQGSSLTAGSQVKGNTTPFGPRNNSSQVAVLRHLTDGRPPMTRPIENNTDIEWV